MSSDDLNAPSSAEEEVEALRQADLALNIFLLLFCAAAIAITLQFPVFEQRPTTWPGWLPLLLLIGLAGMAVQTLVSVHLREPRFRDLTAVYQRCWTGLWKAEFHRSLLILALMFLYVSYLFPRLPYLASTSIFVFASIMAFRAAPWWLAGLVAVINSFVLYFIFGRMYQIPLP